MVRVFIVDDEHLIRELIKNSIEWEQNGFTLCGEAEDGPQAIDRIEETVPDIVILDIKIPFLDGIDVAKKLHTDYPRIKIVILTGYAEFEYAKEAIKAGVKDYLLKPIDPEELLNTLTKLKKETEQEKKGINSTAFDNASDSDIIKEHYLFDLVHGLIENNATSIEKNLISFGSNIGEINIRAAIIEIDNFSTINKDRTGENKTRISIFDFCRNQITPLDRYLTFESHYNRLTIIFNDTKDDDREAESIFFKMLFSISKNLDITLTIALSDIHAGFNSIITAYREAFKALEHKYFQGNNRIIRFEAFTHNRMQQSTFVIENQEAILISLRLGNKKTLLEYINGILEELATGLYSKNTVVETLTELTRIGLRFAAENKLNIRRIVGNNHDVLGHVQSFESFREAEQWVRSFFLQIMYSAMTEKTTKTHFRVKKAIEYIEEHFTDADLTVKKISENVYLDPSYLSKIFKKETRSTISKYVNQHKLNKAKELIDKNPHIKIGDLAFDVGYQDPYYFSKCFKKQFGVAPSAYVEEKLK